MILEGETGYDGQSKQKWQKNHIFLRARTFPLCLWLCGFELLYSILELIIPPFICSRTFWNKMCLNPAATRRFSVIDQDMACVHSSWQWLAQQQSLWSVDCYGDHFPSSIFLILWVYLWFPQNLRKNAGHTHTIAFVCVCPFVSLIHLSDLKWREKDMKLTGVEKDGF